MDTIKNNPAAFAAALRAFLVALLGVVAAFWPNLMTPEQTSAILVFTGAAVALGLLVSFGYTVPKTQPKDKYPDPPVPTWTPAGMSTDGTIVIWNDGTLNHFWQYVGDTAIKEVGTAPRP